jgi:hypothetical protein
MSRKTTPHNTNYTTKGEKNEKQHHFLHREGNNKLITKLLYTPIYIHKKTTRKA